MKEKRACTVYLVRHGQTDWNLASRFQGQADTPLNPQGQKQAGMLGEYFAHIPLSAIYSSDLQRAVATAGYVAHLQDKKPQLEVDLREISLGEWEGCTLQEMQKNWPQKAKLWRENPAELAIPGGEGFVEAQARIYEAVLAIVDKHMGETILIVSHGGAIRLILAAVLGLPLSRIWQIWLDTASINKLDFFDDGQVVLRQLNHWLIED